MAERTKKAIMSCGSFPFFFFFLDLCVVRILQVVQEMLKLRNASDVSRTFLRSMQSVATGLGFPDAGEITTEEVDYFARVALELPT